MFFAFSVLNGCTRRGPFVANSLGVLALMYSTLDYGIGKLRDKEDQYNSIAAAVSTGVIFKSTGNEMKLNRTARFRLKKLINRYNDLLHFQLV